VVAYQAKAAALSKYCGFVVERAVFKEKDETRHYLIPTNDLDEITGSKNLAVHRAQSKKSVHGSLQVVHSYLFSPQEKG
jgi:hypothetical protein